MKRILTINPAITENTECLIVKVRTPAIDIKVGVSLYNKVYNYSSFHFQLFERLTNIPSLRSTLASTTLAKVSYWSIICVPQIVTNAAVEKGMEYKGEQR